MFKYELRFHISAMFSTFFRGGGGGGGGGEGGIGTIFQEFTSHERKGIYDAFMSLKGNERCLSRCIYTTLDQNGLFDIIQNHNPQDQGPMHKDTI